VCKTKKEVVPLRREKLPAIWGIIVKGEKRQEKGQKQKSE
jgi:hypothetical protein